MTEPLRTIEPGLSPGGLVFRLYDGSGEQIHERLIGPDVEIEPFALADTEVALEALEQGQGPIILAAYDGDDGALMSTVLVLG